MCGVCNSRNPFSWSSLSPDARFGLFMLGLWLVWQFNQTFKIFTLVPRFIPCESKPLANVPDRFDGFDNRVARADGDEAEAEALVPNVIHFVRMGERSGEVRPEEAACISAALRTQPGASVVVHSDTQLGGEAWRRLYGREGGGRLTVRRRPRPLHIFGLPIRDDATLHRVAALRILTKHGGVYVSNTAYLRADLAPHRRYECVTASTAPPSSASSPEVVAAHRDARLLHRWLHHFHDAAFVWQQRPAASPELCRDLDADDKASAVVVSLQGVDDPTAAIAVSPEDWYLWGRQEPGAAGAAADYDWLQNLL